MKTEHVRGMLLEEIALALLAQGGYKTITHPFSDQTLRKGPAGIEVCGRGGQHQIDAIADAPIHHPFSYPQRLLVEAKCWNKDIGIDVIRSAVAVLKDVNEFWVSRSGNVPKQRFHYQYAVFSATPFSGDAQKFAFAHDVYLFPLADSSFFKPVLEAVRRISERTLRRVSEANVTLHELRMNVRDRLQKRSSSRPKPGALLFGAELEHMFTAARTLRFALLTVLNSTFPVLLIPNPAIHTSGVVKDDYEVRVFRNADDSSWVLRDARTNRDLFSFDLPTELFLEYAKEGDLTPEGAVKLKEQSLKNLYAYHVNESRIRLVNIRIDENWLQHLRANITAKSGN